MSGIAESRMFLKRLDKLSVHLNYMFSVKVTMPMVRTTIYLRQVSDEK